MIYLDANLFIYAYFKPKKGKELSKKIQWCKQEAKKIVEKINDEENNYCISLIQLSEVVNLLKNVMSWENLRTFIMGLYSNKSIEIADISRMLYLNASDKMGEYYMDSNDISAYLIMKKKKIEKIYTFDRHFEKLPEIKCLPKIPDKF
ncbi:MAG: type II toxin-antitoxin system VapC family toxin [Promethearchaeia archaeon]